jgi:uncharacterized protein with PQ loop repeat
MIGMYVQFHRVVKAKEFAKLGIFFLEYIKGGLYLYRRYRFEYKNTTTRPTSNKRSNNSTPASMKTVATDKTNTRH